MQLGIAAGQEYGIGVGRRGFVGKRAEEAQTCPLAAPGVEQGRIGEDKRRISGNRDAAAQWRDRQGRFGRRQTAWPREGRDRFEIEAGRTGIGGAFEKGFDVRPFACRYEPQMSLGQRKIGMARNAAQERGRRAMELQRVAQQGHVAGAADPVGDGTGDVETFGGVFVSRHQGPERGGKPARIDDEQHRPAGFRSKSGGRGRAGGVDAVVKPHRALAQHEVGVAAEFGDEACPRGSAHRPRIDIWAGPSGGSGMEGRVDIVGADFRGRDAQALAHERPRNAQRQGRLAAARGGCGQNQTRRRGQERRSPAAGPLVSGPRSRRQPRISMQRRYSSATTDWPTLRPTSFE